MNLLTRFPHNLRVLALTQPLAMGATPLMVLIGGLLGTKLAPVPELATLPVALMVIGTAASTVPAAMLMKKIGRRSGFLFGMSLALIGLLINGFAALYASFLLLLLGTFLIGACQAYVQQFRFAAIESLPDQSDAGIAVSILMLGGVAAAFIGPELGAYGENLIESPHGYAGSFFLMSGVVVIAMLVFAFYRNQQTSQQQIVDQAIRPLNEIISQPVFIVAVMAAAIGFGLMSFIMTATPISMHHMSGHSLIDTKWVIQSHIMAMFLPSLFTGSLIKKFGIRNILIAGSVCYLAVIVVGLAGQHLVHYWWALVLLGVGWNFLFVGGTTLLPQTYTETERFKVQAINDFMVFGVQALASLSAGWVIFQFGWYSMIWSALPITLVMLVAAWQLKRHLSVAPAAA